MEVYNNRVCLTVDEVSVLMCDGTRKSLISRNQLIVARRGCRGVCALYEAHSLPAVYMSKARELWPWIDDMHKVNKVANEGLLVKTVKSMRSADAQMFFEKYVTAEGRHLEREKINEYVNNAIIMDAIVEVMRQSNGQRLRQGMQPLKKSEIYQKVVAAMASVDLIYYNTLPSNPRSLQRKVELYQKEGYESIVSGLYGNKNSSHVTDLMERIVLSIYSMKNKPYVSDVVKMYYKFATGQMTIVDRTTGEIIDPSDVYKNGAIISLTDMAAWKIINDPKNRAVVDAKRNDALYNKKTHTPYLLRKAPEWSLSKISMDDRDLPRKCTNGDKVCAYYAYDVASGCVIGASYSKVKDIELVYDCFRDMMRNIAMWGLNAPMEVEVEHHLMNTIESDLHQMFSVVRFCAPGNSQEKRAEHFNRVKKYTAEKQLGQTNGRWWARGEANLERSERIGAEYKEVRLPFDRLVADDREASMMYNNQLHPDQKLYKGMTRLQVLLERQNPNSRPIDLQVWTRAVGNSTVTSVRRHVVTVNHEKFRLDRPETLSLFKPNDLGCIAYWLPDAEGNVESVFIYQQDRFICECKKVQRFSEATVEQTDKDRETMTEQLNM